MNIITLFKKIVLIEKVDKKKSKSELISIDRNSVEPFLIAYNGNTSVSFEVKEDEFNK